MHIATQANEPFGFDQRRENHATGPRRHLTPSRAIYISRCRTQPDRCHMIVELLLTIAAIGCLIVALRLL